MSRDLETSFPSGSGALRGRRPGESCVPDRPPGPERTRGARGSEAKMSSPGGQCGAKLRQEGGVASTVSFTPNMELELVALRSSFMLTELTEPAGCLRKTNVPCLW
ncbi:uncharacterized protein LOC144291794 isoform X2 [Canis aureus]